MADERGDKDFLLSFAPNQKLLTMRRFLKSIVSKIRKTFFVETKKISRGCKNCFLLRNFNLTINGIAKDNLTNLI